MRSRTGAAPAGDSAHNVARCPPTVRRATRARHRRSRSWCTCSAWAIGESRTTSGMLAADAAAPALQPQRGRAAPRNEGSLDAQVERRLPAERRRSCLNSREEQRDEEMQAAAVAVSPMYIPGACAHPPVLLADTGRRSNRRRNKRRCHRRCPELRRAASLDCWSRYPTVRGAARAAPATS
jgi:hypothetical protein